MPATILADGFQSLSNGFKQCVSGNEPGDPVAGECGEDNEQSHRFPVCSTMGLEMSEDTRREPDALCGEAPNRFDPLR